MQDNVSTAVIIISCFILLCKIKFPRKIEQKNNITCNFLQLVFKI